MNITNKLKSNRIGVSFIFLVCGLTNGVLFSNLPYLQDKLSMDYSQISLALLAGTLGSFPTLFFSGFFIDKFGSKRVISLTSIAYCIVLYFLFWAPSIALLTLFLFINGVVVGFLDVAMNSRAVEIEEGYGKSIMSSFHAFYSLAGFIAAGGTKLAKMYRMPVSKFVLIIVLILLLFCIYALYMTRSLNAEKKDKGKKNPLITLPKGILIGLSILVFLAFISEGAIGDWAAVFLNKEQGLDSGTAALGYGLFSIFMALGRLVGDGVTRKIGQLNTLRFSSLFSALALFIAIVIPSPLLSLFFIGLMGLGMANIVPILFSAAGNSGIMSPSRGIASVSMIGYAGFILGPPLMGFIGDLILLRFALLIIVFFSIVIALSSGFFFKSGKNKAVTILEKEAM